MRCQLEILSGELDLRALLVKWQRVLRLQDWDVSARIASQQEVGVGANASCNVNRALHHATIRIVSERDFGVPEFPEWRTYDPEVLLVHELLHIPADAFAPGPVDKLRAELYEQFIETLAHTLIELSRGPSYRDMLVARSQEVGFGNGKAHNEAAQGVTEERVR